MTVRPQKSCYCCLEIYIKKSHQRLLFIEIFGFDGEMIICKVMYLSVALTKSQAIGHGCAARIISHWTLRLQEAVV